MGIYTGIRQFIWAPALLDRVEKIYPEVKVFLGFSNTDRNRINQIVQENDIACTVVDVTALCKNWPDPKSMFIEDQNHIITSKGFLAFGFGELVSSSLGMRAFIAAQIEPYLPEEFIRIDAPLSFVETAEANDLTLMKTTYSTGTDVDAFEGLYTALHHAIKHNNLEMVRYLLDKGADINLQSFSNNETPLILAASDDKIKITGLLLEKGADPFIRNYQEKTPYKSAVENGQAKTAKAHEAALGELAFLAKENLHYAELIKSGIKPGITPDYAFPCSKQHHNACFGFAVKHLVQYKYGDVINVDASEKKIGKSRDDLWDNYQMMAIAGLHGLKYTWEHSTNSFFLHLIRGEPVAKRSVDHDFVFYCY